eukprot:gene5891-1052_t
MSRSRSGPSPSHLDASRCDPSEALLAEADGSLAAGSPDVAHTLFTLYLDRRPHFAPTLARRAAAALAMGMPRAALHDTAHALYVSPRDSRPPDTCRVHARALLAAGRPGDACRWFLEAEAAESPSERRGCRLQGEAEGAHQAALNNLEVYDHPDLGRSLVARKDFAVGECILAEPPLAIWEMCSDIDQEHSSLAALHGANPQAMAVLSILPQLDEATLRVIHGMHHPPLDMLHLMPCYSSYKAVCEALCHTPRFQGQTADSLLRILMIAKANSLAYGDDTAIFLKTGVFAAHSCRPNSAYMPHDKLGIATFVALVPTKFGDVISFRCQQCGTLAPPDTAAVEESLQDAAQELLKEGNTEQRDKFRKMREIMDKVVRQLGRRHWLYVVMAKAFHEYHSVVAIGKAGLVPFLAAAWGSKFLKALQDTCVDTRAPYLSAAAKFKIAQPDAYVLPSSPPFLSDADPADPQTLFRIPPTKGNNNTECNPDPKQRVQCNAGDTVRPAVIGDPTSHTKSNMHADGLQPEMRSSFAQNTAAPMVKRHDLCCTSSPVWQYNAGGAFDPSMVTIGRLTAADLMVSLEDLFPRFFGPLQYPGNAAADDTTAAAIPTAMRPATEESSGSIRTCVSSSAASSRLLSSKVACSTDVHDYGLTSSPVPAPPNSLQSWLKLDEAELCGLWTEHLTTLARDRFNHRLSMQPIHPPSHVVFAPSGEID